MCGRVHCRITGTVLHWASVTESFALPPVIGGAMTSQDPNQLRLKSRFGEDDTPLCPRCGLFTYLIRRAPHLKDGVAFEHQVFGCVCGHTIKRTVDEAGQATTSE